MKNRVTRMGAAMAALICQFVLMVEIAVSAELEAAEIVKKAIAHGRDVSSYTVLNMGIHRPDWEREMTMRVWTQGDRASLVRVLEPAKDSGNASLILGNDMWNFSPKTGRIVKIPISLMHQGWMGSDFNNRDLAKADDLAVRYHHRLLETEMAQDKKVYVIECTPREDAAIVWGKEIIKIREDFIVLQHGFYDQNMTLVKTLQTLEIKNLGGKEVAVKQRMQRADSPAQWTQITIKEAQFGIPLPESAFTLSSLGNPRI